MPRLNLRKTAAKPSGGRGKGSSKAITPLTTKLQGGDDDISSDEEEDVMETGKKRKKGNESDEEEEEKFGYETAEEKRRRLAQQYLHSISHLDGSDDEEASDDEKYTGIYQTVSEKLKKDRLKSQGRWAVDLSPQFESLNTVEDITTAHYGGHQGSITCLSVPQDESFVITGSKDNAVCRYDTETGQRQFLKRKWSRAQDGDQQSHHGEILAVAVSSDGKYVASGGRDRIIRIHDSRTENSEVHSFTVHRDAISGLCFQSGTYSLFSASFDRCVKYFDLNEMAYVETAFGHQDSILSIDCWHKLRPLTSSADRTNRYWKIEDNAHLVFRGHKAQIDTAKILNDSSFISGGEDGKLCLWDHGKKTPISTITEAHGTDTTSANARWLTSVAAIRACDVVASGSYDGYVRLWSVGSSAASKNGNITGKLRSIQALPVAGFVNDLYLSSRLMIAGVGREHRLGRWWNLKGNQIKDRLTIMRFAQDLGEIATSSAAKKTNGYVTVSDEDNEDYDEEEEEDEEEEDEDD